MPAPKSTLQGQALLRLAELQTSARTQALIRVRAAEDPAAAIEALEPATREYVELALLSTMTTSLLAARLRGASTEAIAARARTIPAPLYERLQAMVQEQWRRR